MTKDKRKLIVLLLIIVAVASVIYWYIRFREQVGENMIRISGNIEVTDVEVSFRIQGWVKERPVSEGELIKAGEIVAILDSEELVQEVSQRKAEVKSAEAALYELESGSRPEEIAEGEAVVSRTMSDLDRLRVDHKRQKELHEKDIISTREYEAVKSEYEAAQARYREAMEQLKLLKKGPRQEKIDRARADLERANEALAVAQTRLSYASIFSPISGIILSENVEPGEYVSPGTPVVTIGDLENTWLRAYINETDLGRVKVGHKVHVTTDTYPDKVYEGYISFIASEAEFTPKNVQTEEERVKLVYRVKIEVPNPDMELKPGMPADAEIIIETR